MVLRARDNPFAVQRVLDIGYEPVGWTWDVLLARLETFGWRAAIVGPHGSGKTTLLEGLAPRLRERGWSPLIVRLNQEKRSPDDDERAALRAATPQTVVLVDGSELLSITAWARIRRWCRPARGIIVTSHGRARLPVALRCEADPGVLGWITHRLTGEPTLSEQEAAALLRRHGGNMRHALLELYDRWGERAGR